MAEYTLTKSGELARVLEVAGPLEHRDATRFRDQLDQFVVESSAKPVIVDLSALELISSACMRLLVQFQRALEKIGVKMITVGLRGTAREAMEITGMTTLLETAPSLEDAVGKLGTPA